DPLVTGVQTCALPISAADLRRENVAERPAEHALAAQGADLPTARDTECALDQAMVQERDPDLEGVGHARDVDLGEHVPGEPEPRSEERRVGEGGEAGG